MAGIINQPPARGQQKGGRADRSQHLTPDTQHLTPDTGTCHWHLPLANLMRIGYSPPVTVNPIKTPMNFRAQGYELRAQTPDGEFAAVYSRNGLVSLSFPERAARRRHPPQPDAIPPQIKRWHQLTTKALRLALVGVPPETLPPLDVSAGTSFQQAVWSVLRQISLGQTRSYGDIARAIGRPKAVRAAGSACGANPIPIFIPCHRVLAANHKLGGFSGGLEWKVTLLAREGVSLFQERNGAARPAVARPRALVTG
jgi:methylated-DNA-[protein]-cysteine S-methyltransferase